MTAVTPPLPLRRLRRFLRSPKGYLLLTLLGLTAVAAPSVGVDAALTTVAAAVAGAAAMELVLVRWDQGAWRLPGSALLTGLLIGMILDPRESWLVAAAAGILATDAKHLLRVGRLHVFNPAAVGLLAAYLLFATGQGWWGALSELPAPAVILLIAAGVLVADRANKLPAACAFFATYAVLFTAATFTVDPSYLTDIFRPPFLNLALFFGFFMVTDPPTSPVPFGDQVAFGAIVAAVSFMAYMQSRGLYYPLIGVLAGNAAYAAWRQLTSRRRAPLPG